MKPIVQLLDLALKLFVLGLLVQMVLSWFRSPRTRKVEAFLRRVYDPVLRPIRQVVKPITLNTSPPTSVDLAPLILILLIWWLLYPLLLWIFS